MVAKEKTTKAKARAKARAKSTPEVAKAVNTKPAAANTTSKAKATKKSSVKVHMAIYDSSRSEGYDDIERILTLIESEPDNYEIISLDKSITPAGAFICAIIYKEFPDGISQEVQEDLEITINPDGSNTEDLSDIIDISDF